MPVKNGIEPYIWLLSPHVSSAARFGKPHEIDTLAATHEKTPVRTKIAYAAHRRSQGGLGGHASPYF